MSWVKSAEYVWSLELTAQTAMPGFLKMYTANTSTSANEIDSKHPVRSSLDPLCLVRDLKMVTASFAILFCEPVFYPSAVGYSGSIQMLR